MYICVCVYIYIYIIHLNISQLYTIKQVTHIICKSANAARLPSVGRNDRAPLRRRPPGARRHEDGLPEDVHIKIYIYIYICVYVFGLPEVHPVARRGLPPRIGAAYV